MDVDGSEQQRGSLIDQFPFFFCRFSYLAKIAPLAPFGRMDQKNPAAGATEMQIAGRANKQADFLVA